MKGRFLIVFFFFLSGAAFVKGFSEQALEFQPLWWPWYVAAGLALFIAALLEPRGMAEKAKFALPAAFTGGFGALTVVFLCYNLDPGDGLAAAPDVVAVYAIITVLCGVVTFLLARPRTPTATA